MLSGAVEPAAEEESPLPPALPPLSFLSARQSFTEAGGALLQPSLDPNGRCFGSLVRADAPLPVPEQLVRARVPRLCGRRFHYFRPLARLLSDLLLGRAVDLEQPFQALDLQIALVIARRKAGLRRESACGQTTEELRRAFLNAAALCQRRSLKRIEENAKFVFKHTLKQLIAQFARERAQPDRQRAVEEFYAHHFAQTLAADPRLRIEDFLDPLQQRRGRAVPGPKTLSAAYLALVFRSTSFTRDFLSYAATPSPEQSRLMADYLPTVPKKLEKVLFAWEKRFERSAAPEATARQVLGYLDQNYQCKLPWSRVEVLAAVRGFLEQVGLSAPPLNAQEA